MGSFRKKTGKSFGLKANMLGLEVKRQVESLNRMYEGKVEFCWQGYYDGHVYKDVICIKWTADDVTALDLPECSYITPEYLFDGDYKGNLRVLRLPECIKKVDLSRVDRKAKLLSRLILRAGTKQIAGVPCKVAVEKAGGGFVDSDLAAKM